MALRETGQRRQGSGHLPKKKKTPATASETVLKHLTPADAIADPRGTPEHGPQRPRRGGGAPPLRDRPRQRRGGLPRLATGGAAPGPRARGDDAAYAAGGGPRVAGSGPSATSCTAASGGHLRLLKWGAPRHCWGAWTCTARRTMATAVLKWLRANGCPWDQWTRGNRKGHRAVLEWAGERLGDDAPAPVRGRGGRRPPRGAAVAAGRRRPGTPLPSAAKNALEMLEWLRAEGCPWDKHTCAWAARDNHLEALSGCARGPWGEGTQICGAERPFEVLRWARAGGTRGTRRLRRRGVQRPPRGAPVAARNGCPLGGGVCSTRARRASRCSGGPFAAFALDADVLRRP